MKIIKLFFLLILIPYSGVYGQEPKISDNPTTPSSNADSMSGVWLCSRVDGLFDTLELSRTPIIDSDGLIGYSGIQKMIGGKQQLWLAYVKDKDVITCIAHGKAKSSNELTSNDAGRCGSWTCRGTLTQDGKFVGSCTWPLEPNKSYPDTWIKVKK